MLVGLPAYLEAAIAICAGLGVVPEAVLDVIAQLKIPPLRGECRFYGGVEFLLDCYNSSPAALGSSITKLERERGHGRRICVLGTMDELGPEEQQWHESIGSRLANSAVDEVYLMGRGRGWYLAGLRSGGRDAEFLDDDDGSARRLADGLRPGDRVLFKASRVDHLEAFAERVAALLDGRA